MNNDFMVGIAVSSSSLLFAMAILSGFLLLAILISLGRIYKKAGKPAISAIVPIWSQIVMFQIVGIPIWWIFVPIANIIFMIKAYVLLAKKFGKGTGFAVGMIFLPMIFIPLLSFYDYVGDSEEKESEPIYNPFNQTNVEQVMPSAPLENGFAMNEVTPVAPISMEPVQNEKNTVEEALSVGEIPVTVEPSIVIDNNQVEENKELSEPVVVENNENIPVEDVVPASVPVIEDIVVPQTNLEPFDVNSSNEVIKPIENPTVQDIETILNSKSDSPKDIAFNSMPQIEETVENIDTLNLEEKQAEISEVSAEEVIEMPEIAAKTCPACGVSLADDVKFCTSCGTQL